MAIRALILLLIGVVSVEGVPLCAGGTADGTGRFKTVQADAERVAAVALFARFSDSPDGPVPSWSTAIFDPDRPGSFSHFYDEMSFGRHEVRGEVVPRYFVAPSPASAYLSAEPADLGGYPEFARDIVQAADASVDFSRFDNDGPDGIPNSGDDDGVVDALFLILPQTPEGFIRGEATGVGRLGWDKAFETNDIGTNGAPIRIRAGQGTLQRGRTYNEAVGSMAHEYGHILGLPDLYNIDFLATAGAGPEFDSAGIGNWGLMGWGATGWGGDDGPNPFSAWSRVRLGWAQVEDLSNDREDIFVEDVAANGVVYRLPLTSREYFLLESRSRSASYYDRNAPGEGLLIWHAGRSLPTRTETGKPFVDLECADGLWLDAGPPRGSSADLAGGDNLDFWAHDDAYRTSHAGNLGDSGDLFVDGGSFTSTTNPASTSNDGLAHVNVVDIRRVEGGMVASVRSSPMILAVENITVRDESGDGIIVSGEPVQIGLSIANQGGLLGQDVSVRLRSDDPTAEILLDRAFFGEIRIGFRDHVPDNDFPRLRFSSGFTGEREALVHLEVFSEERLIDRVDLTLRVQSPAVAIDSVTFVGTDSLPRPAVRTGDIALPVLYTNTEIPGTFQASLSLVQDSARLLGDSYLVSSETRSWGPRVLIPTDGARDSLHLVLSVGSIFASHFDTFGVAIEPSSDRSPPLVEGLRLRWWGDEVRASISPEGYVDASPIAGAHLVIRSADGERTVPLSWDGDAFSTAWRPSSAGPLRAQAVLEDAAGNQGRGRVQLLGPLPGSPTGSTGQWQQLRIAEDDGVQISLLSFVFTPADPAVVHAVSQQAIWRSTDAGSTWRRLSLMLPGPPTGLLVSPADARHLVVEHTGRTYLSRNAGVSWEEIAAPGRLLALGSSGLLFAGSSDGLLRSDDWGTSWTPVSDVRSTFFVGRLDRPGTLLSGNLTEFVDGQTVPGDVIRSLDAGTSWESIQVPGTFNVILPATNSSRIYGAEGTQLWRSDDDGSTWSQVGRMPIANPNIFDPTTLTLTSESDSLLHVWDSRSSKAARSTDGGESWTSWSIAPQDLNASGSYYPNPYRPGDALRTTFDYLRASSSEDFGALRSTDFGRSWEIISPNFLPRPAGFVTFDRNGHLRAGVGEVDSGLVRSSLYEKPNDGAWRRSTSYSRPFGLRGMIPAFTNWVTSSFARDHVFASTQSMVFRAPNSNYGIGVGGAALLSEDAGTTWTELTGTYFYRRPSVALSRGAVFTAPGNGELWVRYVGAAWEKVQEFQPDGNSATAVAVLPSHDSGVLVALGAPYALSSVAEETEIEIWRGAPASSWERLSALGESGTGVVLFEPLPDADALLALTTKSLFRSVDAGRSWQRLGDVPQPLDDDVRLRTHPLREDTYLLVSGPDLWVTEDAGRNWEAIDSPPADEPYYLDAAFDPLAPRRLVVATPWGLFERDVLPRTSTSVLRTETLPEDLGLGDIYPNPFNASIRIGFAVAPGAQVDLAIYNVLGQMIRKLPARPVSAGTLLWDGRDQLGRPVGTGVYIVRLRSGDLIQSRKVTLLR